VVSDWVVDYESHHLGRRVVLAACADDHPLCPRSVDLS
jgi:hypothetical protein